jgi:hypothetical protein
VIEVAEGVTLGAKGNTVSPLAKEQGNGLTVRLLSGCGCSFAASITVSEAVAFTEVAVDGAFALISISENVLRAATSTRSRLEITNLMPEMSMRHLVYRISDFRRSQMTISTLALTPASPAPARRD